MSQSLATSVERSSVPAGQRASMAALPSISVFRDLESLAPVWRELEQAGHSTVFQTWAVFEAWVRFVAGRQGLTWLVIAVMHPVTRTPLLLLPLVVRRADGLQAVECADLGVCDYNGPVVAKSFQPSADDMGRIWYQILDALPAGDVLHLTKLPKVINGQKNPLLALPGVHRMALSSYGTPLSRDWNAWVSQTIEPKLLKDIEARTRKFEKRGKVEFNVITDHTKAAPVFEAMCVQRAERHAAMGRPNILGVPGYREFYQALFADEQRTGPALIASLTIDGSIVATGYGLANGTAVHMIFPTFKADGWRNYSPGLQMFVRTMRWASENGYTYFDFTIGGESFKRDLGASERPLFEKAFALSPRGLPFVMGNRLKRVVRQTPAAAHWAFAALAAFKLTNMEPPV